MKKLWLYVMVLAMLLSAAVLCVSAELPYNGAFTPGRYGVEDPEAFAPVGDVPIQWDRDITQKIDLTDGDVSDWYEAGYARTDISPANMVAWVGDHTNLAGWGMTAWFVADPDYVYMAFDISDPTFTYSDPDSYYNGDAIQLAIDFQRHIQCDSVLHAFFQNYNQPCNFCRRHFKNQLVMHLQQHF